MKAFLWISFSIYGVNIFSAIVGLLTTNSRTKWPVIVINITQLALFELMAIWTWRLLS